MDQLANRKGLQVLREHEHVLHRSGMYVGQKRFDMLKMWGVEPNGTDIRLKQRMVSEALLQIIQEIITNVVDQKARTDGTPDGRKWPVNRLDVSMSEDGWVQVRNNGKGFPVEILETDIVTPKRYVPEIALTQLRASENYDDTKTRAGISGTYGVGAALTVIFSDEFTVETVDPEKKLKYTQTFRNNLTEIGKPKITAYSSPPYTLIKFLPSYVDQFKQGASDDSNKTVDVPIKQAVEWSLPVVHRIVFDVAAMTPGLTVSFNGVNLSAMLKGGFADYMKLMSPKIDPILHWKSSDGMWEMTVTTSDTKEFQMVSYVNGLSVPNGGKHVDLMMNQLTRMFTTYANSTPARKKKLGKLDAAHLRAVLFVGVSASVSSPAYAGQTKHTLSTPLTMASFSPTGTQRMYAKPELTEDFIVKISKLAGVVQAAENAVVISINKANEASDSKGRADFTGDDNVLDANWAGTKKSQECTLILCEGKSAFSSVRGALSTGMKNTVGALALRGKIINAREASPTLLAENAELKLIKKMLGLKAGVDYKDTNSLRYRRVVYLFDFDLDGFSIVGLANNLFHHLFPGLLRIPGFLSFFVTPLLKVFPPGKNKKPFIFYSDERFRDFRNSPRWPRGAEVKYYKGLATHKNAEMIEYFSDFENSLMNFNFTPDTPESMRLAYDKDAADDRKEWLMNYDKDEELDYGNVSIVPYEDFTNFAMKHYAYYTLGRAIPSVMDGFKTSTRKVFWTVSRKYRTAKKSSKVDKVASKVSEDTSYHHGDMSLKMTIIGMAQDYVGANNLNLLIPDGAFGTRQAGGTNDAGAPRYIATYANPEALRYFQEQDNSSLELVKEDGEDAEPQWFAPLIPMVLVNGANGIAVGFSSQVPPHKLEDVQEELIKKLKDPSYKVKLTPYIKGHKGTLHPTKTGRGWESHGVMEYDAKTKTFHITEIPAFVSVDKFKVNLKKLLDSKIITNVIDNSTMKSGDEKIDIRVTLTPAGEKLFNEKGDLEWVQTTLGLIGKPAELRTSNMYLLDPNGTVKLYPDTNAIMEDFIEGRRFIYGERITNIRNDITRALRITRSKINMIEHINGGKLDIGKRSEKALEAYFVEHPDLFMKVDGGYKFLTSMPIRSLTLTLLEKLKKLKVALDKRHAYYKKITPDELWMHDLDTIHTIDPLKPAVALDLEDDDEASETGEGTTEDDEE